MPPYFGAKFSMTSLKNGESQEGGGSKKINICLVSRRSVGEHYILITFKIAIKTRSVQMAYFHHLFTRIGMSTTHVDCKYQLRVR